MNAISDGHTCFLRHDRPVSGINALTLSNGQLAVTVLPGKGADIYALTYGGVDVLWKSPQGLRLPGQGRLAADSLTAWLEQYEGGWQEIFPNGGDACQHDGVELSFHGEATLLPWSWRVIEESPETVSVEFTVRLFRSPFTMRRRMTIHSDVDALFIEETLHNWSAHPAALMWGHHPAIGAPLLGDGARLFTNARTVIADANYDPPYNPLVPGAQSVWPFAQSKQGTPIDLSLLPPPTDQRDILMYMLDFMGTPWYAFTNPSLGFGVGWAWGEPFRCCWLWQEVRATTGFPWYGTAYTVACEPWSSYPGTGLAHVIEQTGTQLTLEAGADLDAALTVSFFAIQPDAIPINIALDGTVTFA